MRLGLIVTARCNAACTHCATSCGPFRTEALSREEIERLMTEAAAIHDGEPLRFGISGGEPFLDFAKLEAIVAHGAALGGIVSVATNGYWAASPEAARDKLARLQRAGLQGLSVSVSRFHARYVPLRRARRALETARALGLRTELKAPVTESDRAPGGVLDTWKATLDADAIHVFPVLRYLRADATLPDADYYTERGLPRARCPGALLTIESDGQAYGCCTPGASTPFLALGNARVYSLAELQRRFEHGGLQRLLREQGPGRIGRAAQAAGLGERLRKRYAGPCDLCVHVATDPQLRGVARGLADAYAAHDAGPAGIQSRTRRSGASREKSQWQRGKERRS